MRKALTFILMITMAGTLAACANESAPAPKAEGPVTGTETKESAVSDNGAVDYSRYYEGKTVNIYIPAKSGSSIDVTVRLEVDALQKTLGGTWVVTTDNTGNGTIAYENVINSKPDGLTLLATQNIALAYYGDVYDKFVLDYLTPVAAPTTSTDWNYAVVPGKAPYDTFEEMVEYSKEHELLCGIQNAANSHLMSVNLCQKYGINAMMVEAGSGSDKIVAMLGGTLDFCLINSAQIKDYVENGDLKVLLCLSPEERDEIFDVETEGDSDYTIAFTQTFLYMPKDTPEEIKELVNRTIRDFSKDSELVESFAALQNACTDYDLNGTLELQQTICDGMLEGFQNTGKDMSKYKTR